MRFHPQACARLARPIVKICGLSTAETLEAAIFSQKSITAKMVERGGDDVLPIKTNQKTLKPNVETAFNAPTFPPCALG